MVEDETPVEAVKNAEENVPQEPVSPEAKAESRGDSPTVSVHDEHMEDVEVVQEDVPLEEKIDEVVNAEKPEQTIETLPQSEESPGPEVDIKDEPEPEVEAEAEAEVEMVMASDGEQSTRTDGQISTCFVAHVRALTCTQGNAKHRKHSLSLLVNESEPERILSLSTRTSLVYLTFSFRQLR